MDKLNKLKQEELNIRFLNEIKEIWGALADTNDRLMALLKLIK